MLLDFFSTAADPGLSPAFIMEFITFIIICEIIFMILDTIKKMMK